MLSRNALIATTAVNSMRLDRKTRYFCYQLGFGSQPQVFSQGVSGWSDVKLSGTYRTRKFRKLSRERLICQTLHPAHHDQRGLKTLNPRSFWLTLSNGATNATRGKLVYG